MLESAARHLLYSTLAADDGQEPLCLENQSVWEVCEFVAECSIEVNLIPTGAASQSASGDYPVSDRALVCSACALLQRTL